MPLSDKCKNEGGKFMKYLKGPMLSMNFNETKSGMKKRFENILQNKNR